MDASDRRPAPPGRPVGAEVRRLVSRVVAQAREAGQAELGERLLAEARRRQGGMATVVVAGETKQGKSSLVNALVGRPGLSPVGVEVLTSTYIWLRATPEPAAWIHLKDASGPRQIPPGELGRWTTVDGNPGNRERVQWVEVGLDAPVLSGLDLVDTPGVGGLEQGYGELTMLALQRASALLFVSDAGAPLSAPELAFLRRAIERIDTVIFALTKIDLYRGWREVADENRALLAAHAPALAHAPTVAVSSALAEKAASCGPDQEALAGRLVDLAGVDELARLLRTRVAERAAILDLANAVQLSRHALDVMERSLAGSAEAVEADPSLQAALVAEQERLAALRRENLTWGPRFSHQMKRVRIELGTELSRAVNALGRRYETQLPKRKAGDLDLLPNELEADIAALAGHQFEALTARLREVALELLGNLVEPEVLGAELERLVVADEAPQLSERSAGGRPTSPTELFTSFSSFLSARTAVSLFLARGAAAGGTGMAMLGLGSWEVATVAAGAGVAFAWMGRTIRARAGRRTELLQWVRRELAEASQEIRKAVELALNDAELRLGTAMRGYVEDRSAEINATLEQVKVARDRDLTGRAQARKRVLERQAALRELGGQAEALRRSLHGAVLAQGTGRAPGGTPGGVADGTGGGSSGRLVPGD
jgi:hypothetical protein